MLTAERLREALAKLNLKDANITIEGEPGHLVASIVSPEFAGIEDADRQSRAWGLLLNELTEFELNEVEFVFTSTQEELA